MWINGVVVAIIFFPLFTLYLVRINLKSFFFTSCWCVVCVHDIGFCVYTALHRVFIKIKHIKNSNFFENNTEHVYSFPVMRISFALVLCVMFLCVSVWRKLISDYSQMGNVYISLQCEWMYAFSSIQAWIFLFLFSSFSVFHLESFGRVRKHLCMCVNDRENINNETEKKKIGWSRRKKVDGNILWATKTVNSPKQRVHKHVLGL